MIEESKLANPIAQTFLASGQPMDTRNDQPLSLMDAGKAWYVAAGSVNCFAVPMRGQEIAGPRRFMVHLEAGSLLIGFHAGAEDEWQQIIAVGVGSATLRALPRPQLFAAHRAAREQSELPTLVSAWIEGLLAAVAPVNVPKDMTVLSAGNTVTLEPADEARADNTVLWASVADPTAIEVLGDRVGCIASQIVPVSGDAWLRARARVEISPVTTADLLANATDIPGADAFQQALLRTLATDWRASQVSARQRAVTKLQSLRDAFVQGCSRLLNVLNQDRHPEVFSTGGTADPLLETCRMVGRYSGIEIQSDPKTLARSANPIQAIARSSQVRYRRVLLRGEWWREDNGPLVGVLEQQNAPVALIPASPRQYNMVNVTDRSSVRVDAEVAKQLRPVAIMFYRSFPPTSLGMMDLARFGARGLGMDTLAVLAPGIAGAILALAPPFLTGIVFDSIVPGAERPQLYQIAVILIVAAIAKGIFDLTRSRALLRLTGKMSASLQAAVWDRLLGLPTPFFRDYASGDLAMRADGISQMRDLLGSAAAGAVLTGIFSILSVILLFYYSPSLAGWALAIVIAAFLITAVAAGRSLKGERAAQLLRQRSAGQVLQFIDGVAKLRVSGTEAAAFSIWATTFAEQRRQTFKSRDIGNNLAAVNAALPVVAALIIYWQVLEMSGQGGMSTGDFIAFTAAFATLLVSTIGLSGKLMTILPVIPLYENAKPILLTRPEVDTGKAHPGELSGRIELSHVSFRYRQDQPLILRDLSISIEPGEFVALVGPSGSGKSTTLRLLLGFETPESGTVTYDHQDLRDLDLVAVRQQLGVVLQDGSLIPADIFTNIAGASSGKTLDDAWEAARLAGIDEDIRRMPLGMFTPVMEGGGAFSGGQKQRLMIARALIRKPRILYMDEATSALDNRTQQQVSDSLAALRATRVIIAHRLSTIQAADRIDVIMDGGVVETGTYQELMARAGEFHDLVARQML